MGDFKIPFLSLKSQHASIEHELVQAIQRVMHSNWFVLGSELSNFEKAYANFSNTNYCVGVANGLDALTLSLRALGVGEGDEVIVPSHTFIATWLAVTAVGATPVPVEPTLDTYTIEVTKIEGAITGKTKAIIPVHLYGHPCDMNAIMHLAEKHNLWVVEDNAQAHGARCHNKITGSIGHSNATSFYPGKNLGALGDGGAITTNDEHLYNHLLQLRNYGSTVKYYHEVAGVNSRLDELQASLLAVKLKHLALWTEERKQLAKYYCEKLNGVGDLTLPQIADGYSHVFHLFVLRTNKRDALQQHLASKGIQTLVHYPLPPHLQQAYAHLGYKKGSFPIAEELAQTCLSLPFWPGLNKNDKETIVSEMKKFFS